MGPSDSAEKTVEYKQFVVFFAGDHVFGVNIHQTREIITRSELTFMPDTPDFVSGVINLRGEIVPVIDLEKRLSLQKQLNQDEDEKKEQKIIIAEVKSNLIGIKVNDVREIIRIEKSEIENPPEITRNINRDFVTGVGKMEEELIIFLNLSKILTPGEVEELEDFDLE
ncbi:MAG: chemotaxis protein CheW [Halanaerobiaceae bacterium]